MNAVFSQLGISHRPWVATSAYAAVVVVCIATTFTAASDLLDLRYDLNAASEILTRLQGHKVGSGSAVNAESTHGGSPLLEGKTVTVAGADLLRHVSEAVSKVGGNILSSQVDLQGTLAKNGFIGVILNCEVDQPALQRLLYDLEAGMPFLFVDQLVVQAPAASVAPGQPRMRVTLAVSGQWEGGR